jgi:ribokinase
MRIAVIGHIEHVTIGRAAAPVAPGDIVHFDDPVVIAGGGGAIAFFQLAKSDAELHLFTAIGIDEAAVFVYDAVASTGATIHAALRTTAHTRDVVAINPDGERTIFVVGEPLHAKRDDRLSWDIPPSCDAVYFTGQDADALREARSAKLLVVTARRAHVLADAGIAPDIVVGSATDPRESSRFADYPHPPRALVMTEGAAGGYLETASGITRFAAPPAPDPIISRYGAGDTFAAALTWYAARGLPIDAACARAAAHATAVLASLNPLAAQRPLE